MRRGEGLLERGAQGRPGGRGPALGEGARLEPQRGDERVEELRLQRADGEPLAVGAAVDAVERRAAVERVGLALVAPETFRLERVGHRHQQGDAVGHRGVDDLAAPGALSLQERADDAEGQRHRAAAEIAEQVERRRRRLSRADRVQRAGERDVVDVVAGGLGERPALAPAGDAPEHQLGIARQADLGPEAEALHHAGAEALDQRVGAVDQLERGRRRFRLLQVERDRAAAAIEKAAALERIERVAAGRRLAVDAHDLGAHVGEQHSGEGRRPDAGHLDDLEAGQRTHDAAPVGVLRPCL